MRKVTSSNLANTVVDEDYGISHGLKMKEMNDVGMLDKEERVLQWQEKVFSQVTGYFNTICLVSLRPVQINLLIKCDCVLYLSLLQMLLLLILNPHASDIHLYKISLENVSTYVIVA